MEPTHNSERLHILDLLRGFALLGIIFVNMPVLLEVAQPETIADALYFFLTQFFVENKFFTIFSFLFGVGFYLFLSRAKAKGESAYQLFVRRMVLLLLLGLLHTNPSPWRSAVHLRCIRAHSFIALHRTHSEGINASTSYFTRTCSRTIRYVFKYAATEEMLATVYRSDVCGILRIFDLCVRASTSIDVL